MRAPASRPRRRARQSSRPPPCATAGFGQHCQTARETRRPAVAKRWAGRHGALVDPERPPWPASTESCSSTSSTGPACEAWLPASPRPMPALATSSPTASSPCGLVSSREPVVLPFAGAAESRSTGRRMPSPRSPRRERARFVSGASCILPPIPPRAPAPFPAHPTAPLPTSPRPTPARQQHGRRQPRHDHDRVRPRRRPRAGPSPPALSRPARTELSVASCQSRAPMLTAVPVLLASRPTSWSPSVSPEPRPELQAVASAAARAPAARRR